MPTLPLLFAMDLPDLFRRWATGKNGNFNMLLFFGAAALLALAVFGWAIVFRKQSQAHHSIRPAGSKRSRGMFSKHKRRRKKRRPANPTLAETGGLPPKRDAKTPPRSPL